MPAIHYVEEEDTPSDLAETDEIKELFLKNGGGKINTVNKEGN